MATKIDVHVGRRLREARLAKGMSQTDLGEPIGVSFQQVQKYEKGANRIGGSRLWAISNVLEVPVGFFFEGLGKLGKTKALPTWSPQERVTRRTLELARSLNAIKDEKVKELFLRLIRDFARIA